jgi:hypothetical protein
VDDAVGEHLDMHQLVLRVIIVFSQGLAILWYFESS